MKIVLKIVVCFISLVFSGNSIAQMKYSTTNEKAIKAYERGIEYYNIRQNDKAKKEMFNAIQKDPLMVEPHFILGNIFEEERKPDLALEEYKKAAKKNPYFEPRILMVCGKGEFSLGNYQEAKMYLEQYIKLPSRDTKALDEARLIIASCEFAVNAIANPVPFKPENMGPAINSEFNEYFPAITADEQTFLFTRKLPDPLSGAQEDFYFSNKNNENWTEARNMGKPINTENNEGAPTLSVDGQILIFTACDMMVGGYGANRKGYGSCDLFFTQRRGNSWAPPVNIGLPVNSGNWETQPSFSSDGKTIYFIRGMVTKSGIKEMDIYMSELDDKGYWKEPLRLGNNVNTSGNEESVFIHPDNQTLYFSSDGRVGMGGSDIYMSRRQADGEWGEPVNLGYPINTYKDENSLLVGAKGDIAYFASNREGGLGGLDIYSFELPNALRPQLVTYMKGKVYNSETKDPLEAKFELLDLETGKLVVESYSNIGNGEFLVTLPTNKNYALNVSKNGYLFFSENFSLKENGKDAKPTVRDVPLKPIKEGEKIVLRNVFFSTASAELKSESKIELDKLVKLLEANPKMKIELSGHTDNVGEINSNIVLSDNRAKAVFNYLISNKIAADRLTYKGYGESQPVSDNTTDEGRTLNRRTEFKVISK